MEELLAFAKENNLELTEDQARSLFDGSRGGEPTDEELAAVSGGAAAKSLTAGNVRIVSCGKCGIKTPHRVTGNIYRCQECGTMKIEDGQFQRII